MDNGKEIVAQPGWREKLKVGRKRLVSYISFLLQAYPEIMADMFEAMTRQPAKRQRLNWVWNKNNLWTSDSEPNILATYILCAIIVASEITKSESFPIQTLSKGAICSVNLVVGGKTQKIAKSIASRNLHRGGFGYLPPKFTNVINLQKMKILPEINAVKEDFACCCWERCMASERTSWWRSISLRSWKRPAVSEWLFTLESANLWPRCPCHKVPTSFPCWSETFQSMWQILRGGWWRGEWCRCRCRAEENDKAMGMARVEGSYHNPGGWREGDGAILQALLATFLWKAVSKITSFSCSSAQVFWIPAA